MRKVVHIITDLDSGGAERMLYNLLENSKSKEITQEVIVLKDKGVYGEDIEKMGINIYPLKLNLFNFLWNFVRMFFIIKEVSVISTWLYHSDFIGFIYAFILKKKLIWNIRHSNLNYNENKRKTFMLIKVNAKLSKFTTCITFNSREAYENHINIGYKSQKMKIVYNGINLDKFAYSDVNRKLMEKKLQINLTKKRLITVGRWYLQKDYLTLFKALSIVIEKNENWHLFMIGNGLTYENMKLTKMISKYNLNSNITLLGVKKNVEKYLSTSDIYISSSLGESFSNSILEAMTNSLKCIVTDVGESSNIVGDYGCVVKPKDYKNLAVTINNVLSSTIQRYNHNQVNYIEKNFSIRRIVRKYEELYIGI